MLLILFGLSMICAGGLLFYYKTDDFAVGCWVVSIPALAIMFGITALTPAGPLFISKESQIVSLNYQTALSGSFVLGTGTINEQPVYFYVAKEKYGYQVRNTLRDGDIYLQYSNARRAITMYCTSSYINLLYFSLGGNCHSVIYIPPGTIKKSYSVDITRGENNG